VQVAVWGTARVEFRVLNNLMADVFISVEVFV